MTATRKPVFNLLESKSWFKNTWTSLARGGNAPHHDAAVTAPVRARVLAEALLSEEAEAEGAAIARALHDMLGELTPEDRLGFLRQLATGFTADRDALRAAAEAYVAEPDQDHAEALAKIAKSPRRELLHRMNLAPGGTVSLIGLRETVLKEMARYPELQSLDKDLLHLFTSWFNRGFLELRQIDWQTPAAILEKLISYEAVHEIDGWDDMRRRLAADRRCFGFFHPALPDEPLIFVEVALTIGLATSIQSLLLPSDDPAVAATRARSADTATFYSISSCQMGLRGVSLGNFLIKQVVEQLKEELPNLTQFSTLSPVPGFRRWLEKKIAEEDDASLPLDSQARALLARPDVESLVRDGNEGLQAALLQGVAIFLTQSPRNRGSDSVARFHLHNGARLERLNWRSNLSARGLRESYGIMVNYVYDLPAIVANHRAFLTDGRVVRSVEIDQLLTPPAVETKQGHVVDFLLQKTRARGRGRWLRSAATAEAAPEKTLWASFGLNWPGRIFRRNDPR